MSEIQENLTEDLRALITPKIIDIEEYAWQLLNSAWTQGPLHRLYQAVEELAETSCEYGLSPLDEASNALEDFLGTLLDNPAQPDTKQRDELGTLLKTLRKSLRSIASGDALSPDRARYVFALSTNGGLFTEISLRLQEQGIQTELFADADLLLASIEVQPPIAILADATQEGQLKSVIDRLRHISQEQHIHPIPVAFFHPSDSLQQRIKAMHEGADLFFATPLDSYEATGLLLEKTCLHHEAPYRILLVEPDTECAASTRSELERGDMTVRVTSDPFKVMDEMGAFMPDLILMDANMTGIDGIELTRVIRDHDEFAFIPVIFLSNESTFEKRLEALQAGCDELLLKPDVPTDYLLKSIRSRIQRSHRLAHSFERHSRRRGFHGLFSIAHFLDYLENQRNSKRLEEAGSAILFVQPDRLWEIEQQTDTYEKEIVLSKMGTLISGSLGPQDVATIIDNRGFALFLKRSDPDTFLQEAERLQLRTVTSQIKPEGWPQAVTISIGIRLYSKDVRDAAQFVTQAEQACATAQSQGHNQTYLYQPAKQFGAKLSAVEAGHALRLRDALYSNSLILLYQPLINLVNHDEANYEVRFNLRLPDGEVIPQPELSLLAETGGIGMELNYWTLQQAIQALKSSLQKGQNNHIFIHQSASALNDPDYASWIRKELGRQHLSGSGLVLEFNLADAAHDIKITKPLFSELTSMGIEISLSRCPEKPAAFKVVRYLDVHYLRIAKQLLRASPEVIGEIVSQAHKIYTKVIVSGIDTVDAVDLHWSAGADLAQGLLMHPPMKSMDYDFQQHWDS